MSHQKGIAQRAVLVRPVADFLFKGHLSPVRGKDFLSARSGTTAEDGVFIPLMVLPLQTVLGEFLGLQGRSQHIVEPSSGLQVVLQSGKNRGE